MQLNKRGQSIIEYSLILILVVLGIVVMGPYVLRSINGHFKLWDDQVQDSFNDRLVQAPATDVDLPPNCSIVNGQENVAGSCGVVKGKTVTCQENERYYYANFNPPGCYIAESCVPDTQCCMPVVRGNCGLGQRDASSTNRRSIGKTFKKATVYKPVSITTLPPNNGCYYGEREINERCGNSSSAIIGCIVDTFGRSFDRPGQTPTNPNNTFATDDDDPSCAAMCLGSLPAHGLLCLNDDIDLETDTQLTPAGIGSNSCTETDRRYGNGFHKGLCQYYCEAPYAPINGTCSRCGNGKCEKPIAGDPYTEDCFTCALDCSPPQNVTKTFTARSPDCDPNPAHANQSCGGGEWFINDARTPKLIDRLNNLPDGSCHFRYFTSWHSAGKHYVSYPTGDTPPAFFSNFRCAKNKGSRCQGAGYNTSSMAPYVDCPSIICNSCGNGVLDDGPGTCDIGWTKNDGDPCTFIKGNLEGCQPNGRIDRSGIVGLTCKNSCTTGTTSTCGNGNPDPGEACDEGPVNGTDASTCSLGCGLKANCGNNVQGPGEACEPPNTSECTPTCAFRNTCGNGQLNLGEECDLGNTNGQPGSTCTSLCTKNRCGNSTLDVGESCDYGPLNLNSICAYTAEPDTNNDGINDLGCSRSTGTIVESECRADCSADYNWMMEPDPPACPSPITQCGITVQHGINCYSALCTDTGTACTYNAAKDFNNDGVDNYFCDKNIDGDENIAGRILNCPRDNSKCNPSDKPVPLIVRCSANCTYQWQNPTPYGACSTTCGGTQSRTYTCVETSFNTVVANALCPIQASRPTETQPCINNTSGCIFAWRGTGTFSACASTGVCVGGQFQGTQTENMSCVNSSLSNQPAPGQCSGLAPINTVACNTGLSCP